MKTIGKTVKLSEWVILLGGMAATIIGVRAFGVNEQWEGPSVYTVIVLGGLVLIFRFAWGRTKFWRSFVIAFFVHVLAIFVAIREFPAVTSAAFHGIYLPILAIAEGLIVGTFLWRAISKRTTPSDLV